MCVRWGQFDALRRMNGTVAVVTWAVVSALQLLPDAAHNPGNILPQCGVRLAREFGVVSAEALDNVVLQCRVCALAALHELPDVLC